MSYQSKWNIWLIIKAGMLVNLFILDGFGGHLALDIELNYIANGILFNKG